MRKKSLSVVLQPIESLLTDGIVQLVSSVPRVPLDANWELFSLYAPAAFAEVFSVYGTVIDATADPNVVMSKRELGPDDVPTTILLLFVPSLKPAMFADAHAEVNSANNVPSVALYQGDSVFTEATSAARVSAVVVVGMVDVGKEPVSVWQSVYWNPDTPSAV